MSNKKRKKKRERAKKHARRMGSGAGRADLGGATKKAVGSGPLREAFFGSQLFELGMGSVVISRDLLGGGIGMGVFLLDVFCLGVKNAFLTRFSSEYEYRDALDQIASSESLEPTAAPRARKLIEGAVEYARSLGFSPHRDYRRAALILGDIDPGECREEFVFGQAGKPCYVSGPHDSKAMVGRVLATLRDRCGEDGFHYTIGL